MSFRLLIGSMMVAFVSSTGVAQQSEPDTIPSAAHALRFADFLYDLHEYALAESEYRRYLFFTPNAHDSVSFRIGICKLRGDSRNEAALWFHRLSESATSSHMRLSAQWAEGYALFHFGRIQEADSLLTICHIQPSITDDRTRFLAAAVRLAIGRPCNWKALRGDEAPDQLWEALETLERDHIRNPPKSPLLAGMLSAAIPGMGKVYAGHWEDGISAFFMVGISAWQGYEGFRKEGISSAKGWILGGLAAAMYGGNIIGSVLQVRIDIRASEESYHEQIQMLVEASMPF
jgi:hypothetical protein